MKTEIIFETARLLIDSLAEHIDYPAPNRMDITLKQPEDLVTVVAGLRVKRLGYLSAITGLDLGVGSNELEVLYHFCTGEVVLTLRVRLRKSTPKVPSLGEIVPSAEPHERELREMFGITVTGLRTPEFLYLPEDWQEGDYPLRKNAILAT